MVLEFNQITNNRDREPGLLFNHPLKSRRTLSGKKKPPGSGRLIIFIGYA
jgi:hypothetical protein